MLCLHYNVAITAYRCRKSASASKLKISTCRTFWDAPNLVARVFYGYSGNEVGVCLLGALENVLLNQTELNLTEDEIFFFDTRDQQVSF